jgi:LysM repeat protein
VSFVSHEVEAGETLSGISDQYGVTIDDILGANGRTIENASFIRAGQSIVIPMQS